MSYNFNMSQKNRLRRAAHSFRQLSENEWNEAFYAGFECSMNFSMTVLFELGEWKKKHLLEYREAMCDMMIAFNKDPQGTLDHMRAMIEESQINTIMPEVEK